MANEITVRSKQVKPNGVIEWSLLLWFDWSATPVTDNAGNKVVVQSSGQIPPDVSSHVDQAKKDAIDSGDAGFLVFTVHQTPGETNAALLARVQAAYSQLGSWLRGGFVDQHENAGLSVDA